MEKKTYNATRAEQVLQTMLRDDIDDSSSELINGDSIFPDRISFSTLLFLQSPITHVFYFQNALFNGTEINVHKQFSFSLAVLISSQVP